VQATLNVKKYADKESRNMQIRKKKGSGFRTIDGSSNLKPSYSLLFDHLT